MRVRRSELSLRVSIQRESLLTGAKAISASLMGSGPGSAAERTKRSRPGPAVMPGRTGFHCVAGAIVDSIATLRGPVRRSYTEARVRRQLEAAMSRSAGVSDTCTNFSASAKVFAVTSGPTCGAVPKAGGAPGGGVPGGAVVAGVAVCASTVCVATTAPSTPSGAWIRNWRRVFMAGPSSTSISSSSSITAGRKRTWFGSVTTARPQRETTWSWSNRDRGRHGSWQLSDAWTSGPPTTSGKRCLPG